MTVAQNAWRRDERSSLSGCGKTIRAFAIDVLVEGRPIRASCRSALWCLAVVEQLWDSRGRTFSLGEREQARRAFDHAIEVYRRIASENP
jgi:hypothetical protein